MTEPSLPGSRWFAWLRNLTLRIGVLTGVYLSLVMVISLFAANRISFLDRFADPRNLLSLAAFVLMMFIPIGYFRRHPARMFAASLCGWMIFALSYAAMGLVFERLHTRFYRPFHVFVLGALCYGVVAVVLWVASMVRVARQQPLAATRRRPY